MTHRPEFHISPKIGRLNDPNGLLFHQQRWHAFFQLDPSFPVLPKQPGWGHVSSKDLVNWEPMPQVLFPDQPYDKDGCYSGSATFNKNGAVEFFYTGNVKKPDGTRGAFQCVATPEGSDLETFIKSQDNPLIGAPAPGFTSHFRDPHVIRINEDSWRMILGAQTEDVQGAVVIYESTNLRDWGAGQQIHFEGPVPGGYMWECPNLINMVDESDGQIYQVLIFCPQGIREQSGGRFLNRYQCGYLVGTLGTDEQRHIFTVSTPFQELDHGFEFYAPQVFAGTARHLLLAWLGSPEEDEHPSLKNGWVHCLSAARELRLVNGFIQQSLITPENLTIAKTGQEHEVFEVTVGVKEKLILESALNPADRVEVKVDEKCVAVRRHCSLIENPFGDTRSVKLQASITGVRVIVDRSVIEIITNDGQASLSLRAFVSSDLWHVKTEKLDESHNPF